MYTAFPFRLDERGRTQATSDEAHVRDLIEQVLFTSPGERVNRPDFGSGLMNLVFAPPNEVLAATAQQLVQSALSQWLGELIQVEAVRVEQEDSTLRVTVTYTLRRDRRRRVAELVRTV